MLLMKDLTTLYIVMGEGDLCGKKSFFSLGIKRVFSRFQKLKNL